MASKKNRPNRPSPSTLRPLPKPDLPPNGPAPAEAASATLDKAGPRPPAPAERTAMERVVIRVARSLGSLQLAVVSLSLLVVVLAVGTMVESWYTAKLAQQLVYKTWWFNLLMAALFLNIFFAAAKKWPWKRHQTGFVITHLGLLLLITGGVVNSLTGTDTLMVLVTEDSAEAAAAGATQVSRVIKDPDEALIEVYWPSQYGREGTRQYFFSPGALTWGSAPEHDFRLNLDPMLRALYWLAQPLPKSWEVDLGNGARLEVLNYFTHVRLDSYKAAGKGEEAKGAGPALHVELKNPRIGETFRHWLTTDRARSMSRQLGGLASFELLGIDPVNAEQVREFENPPPADELGEMGQLVLILDGQAYRFPVDRHIGGAPAPLGESGWKVRVRTFSPDGDKANRYESVRQFRDDKKSPFNPILNFELLPPDASARPVEVETAARLAGYAQGLTGPIAERLSVWYHPPDYRHGFPYRGLLQFVIGPGGELHYRSFNTGGKPSAEGGAAAAAAADRSGFGLEKSGTVTPGGGPVPIWGAMKWEMRVTEFIPRAVAAVKPENKRPGLEHPDFRPAVYCRLTVGKDAKEFWLVKPHTGKRFTTVAAGDEVMQISFHERTEKLPFELKLLRAEQTTDPGTRSAASYSSFVQVNDPKNGEFFEHQITMNEPLEYGGYKFYQTGLDVESLPPNPSTGKPVAISTLTVSSDPGIYLKYLGSVMLALGIATMFYMRAYFFKPRGRKPATQPGQG